MPSQQRFEGPVLEDLLEEVRDRFGADVAIVEANKVRKGGVGGFFARELFEVVVEADDDQDGAEDHGATVDVREPAPLRTLLDLVDEVDDGFVSAASAARQPVAAGASEGLASAEMVAALLDRTAGEPLPDEPIRRTAPAARGTMPTDRSTAPDSEGIGALLAGLDAARARVTVPVQADETRLSTDGDAFASVLERFTRDEPMSGDEAFRSFADRARNDRAAAAAARASESPVPSAPEPDPDPEPTSAPVPAAPVDLVPEPAATTVLAAARRRGQRPAPVAESGGDGRALLDLARLDRLGLPGQMLDAPLHAADRMSALLSLADRFARPRRLPDAGDGIIALVGDRSGMERAVAWVQETIGLSPEMLMLATQSESKVFPAERRIAGHEDAAERRRAVRRRALPTLVVIDDPISIRGTAWTRHVLDALEPSAVWAVVDAQRKPEDVVEWGERIGGLDAIALDGIAETSSPAAILATGIPVALLDGETATAARWATLLDDRLQAA